MRLFKRLMAFKEKEKEGAVLGVGVVRAMDYDNGKRGHLILLSLNLKVARFIKKLFIAF